MIPSVGPRGLPKTEGEAPITYLSRICSLHEFMHLHSLPHCGGGVSSRMHLHPQSWEQQGHPCFLEVTAGNLTSCQPIQKISPTKQLPQPTIQATVATTSAPSWAVTMAGKPRPAPNSTPSSRGQRHGVFKRRLMGVSGQCGQPVLA